MAYPALGRDTAAATGARIGDIVAAGTAAYAEQGFAADEWHNHHQGGPTGYTTRDYLASPATEHAAVDRQTFAWILLPAGSRSRTPC